uniref:Uncharacterized protein n=1 Tax=Stegastes partitus TaxID=144197 RepID=A0A3B5A495_9TELE
GAPSSAAGFSSDYDSGDGADPFGFPFVRGLPWDELPKGGLPPSFFLKHLVPPRLLPDVNAWNTDEVPLGMIEGPPVVPSSYIVQSTNGYQRARELLSHSKFSPDIFDHFPLPSVAQPTGKPPVTGSPGTKAY